MQLKGLLPKKRLPLCIFGGAATYLIYGLIMNFASLLMFSDRVTEGGLIAAYISGIPYDTVHAVATVFFMYVLAEPMIERLDRVRLKYGMIR